jgi:hypothetical protein
LPTISLAMSSMMTSWKHSICCSTTTSHIENVPVLLIIVIHHERCSRSKWLYRWWLPRPLHKVFEFRIHLRNKWVNRSWRKTWILRVKHI